MRVLVTGGAGYVGYSTIGALAGDASIDEVIVADNLSRRQYALFTAQRTHDKVRFVECDILDGRTLGTVTADVDAVIHLAASVQVPTQDGEAHSFDQVNNWGSAQVATAIEQAASVSTVIYLSSITVYGPSEATISVDTVPQPNTFYGVTKLRGESHFRRLATPDRRVHVVRAGNVHGITAAARYDTVVNRFLLDGKFRRRLKVVGTGEQTRSFIEVDRLAASLGALVHSDVPSGTFNFVDHTRSVLEVAAAVQTFAPGIERFHVDQDMRMLDARVRPSRTLHDLVGTATTFEDSLRASFDSLGI